MGGFPIFLPSPDSCEALSHQRRMSLDRLVFSEDFLKMLEREAAAETELAPLKPQALESCLGKLSPEWRELITPSHLFVCVHRHDYS